MCGLSQRDERKHPPLYVFKAMAIADITNVKPAKNLIWDAVATQRVPPFQTKARIHTRACDNPDVIKPGPHYSEGHRVTKISVVQRGWKHSDICT